MNMPPVYSETEMLRILREVFDTMGSEGMAGSVGFSNPVELYSTGEVTKEKLLVQEEGWATFVEKMGEINPAITVEYLQFFGYELKSPYRKKIRQ
ncbi:MAG: hypothetical protein WD897_01705 [Parcubacteria group bacterium]